MRPCQIVSVSNAYFVPGAFHSKNVCSCVLIPFPLIHVGSTVAFLQVLSLSVVVRGGADAFDQVSVVVCGGRCIRSGVCLWWSVVGQMHPIRCLWWSVVGQMHPIRCLSVVVRGGADASDQLSVVVRGGADASDQVSVCGGPWWQMHPIRCLSAVVHGGRCIRSGVRDGPWWGRCIRSGVLRNAVLLFVCLQACLTPQRCWCPRQAR